MGSLLDKQTIHLFDIFMVSSFSGKKILLDRCTLLQRLISGFFMAEIGLSPADKFHSLQTNRVNL